jgi:cytochrome P450
MQPTVPAADWPRSTRVLLGRFGLINIVGARHAVLRKILKPAFSLGAIAGFAPGMAAVAARCCEKWAAQGRVQGMQAAKEYTFLVRAPASGRGAPAQHASPCMHGQEKALASGRGAPAQHAGPCMHC